MLPPTVLLKANVTGFPVPVKLALNKVQSKLELIDVLWVILCENNGLAPSRSVAVADAVDVLIGLFAYAKLSMYGVPAVVGNNWDIPPVLPKPTRSSAWAPSNTVPVVPSTPLLIISTLLVVTVQRKPAGSLPAMMFKNVAEPILGDSKLPLMMRLACVDVVAKQVAAIMMLGSIFMAFFVFVTGTGFMIFP